VETVDTDVVIGPRTRVLADAHDLPFADGSFHAVVVQAVLGNVADPGRAVAEMHRVLMSDGFVYAETNFLQGVCMGPYDFTRYTHVGQRRLFRDFDELCSGVQCGPGMMLSWAVVWFLMALGGRSGAARLAVRAIAPYLVFWLKYLDRYLVDKPGAFDAASATFFLGRRRTSPVPDREILMSYRGAVKTEWLDEQRDATG
jgi:SAM-dependent methyltransferase